MSISNIPEKVKIRLWGKAGGRCQYEGCNEPLWRDSLTSAEFNTAYIAHIVADKPGGPRGDPVLSEELAQDINNLMLMCDKHHRLIDQEDVAGHPIERLQAMKATHESRMEIVTDIAPEMTSHMILYGANIGDQSAPLNYQEAARAMVPLRYPAQGRPIALAMQNSSYRDKAPDFWTIEAGHLQTMVEQQIRPRLASSEISHMSIFAMAPQPLLMLLGALLTDIPVAEVYQRLKEPAGWVWQEPPDELRYIITEPDASSGPPALVFSLSARVSPERIHHVLGSQAAIWDVSVPKPDNDFLRAPEQARLFRQVMRGLMDRIKFKHPRAEAIHVFPAMPVCLAVELGRILMPKADLPLKVYDQNHKTGGFAFALDINA